MLSRLSEFFEDDNERLSMSRLLCFLSFFPASYVLIANARKESAATILGIYLGAYVLGYLGGKGADAWSKPRERRPASPVTINQPEKVNVSGSI